MEQLKIQTIENGLSNYKEQLDKIISKETLIKEIGFAVQSVNSNTKLQQCSQVSVIKAVYNVALTGLSLNPIHKLAALVPKYINGEWSAVLFPQYQGLVKLLTDTGSVINCNSFIVYEGDEFDVEYGSDPRIVHKPKFKSKVVQFVYAIAKLYDGTLQFEIMDLDQLNFVRSCSETWKAYESGKLKAEHVIWINWESEMYRKTVLKRLCKYLPKTERWSQINEAINIDNEEYKISNGQEDRLYALINTCAYDEDTRCLLESKIRSGLSQQEYETMFADLTNNQLDPITHGGSYNQTDIKKHINKL